MHRLLANSGRALLIGNEAIARGALEAGVGFASTYPGTPSSEIGDSFAEVAKDAGIYFEYSVNEKVAVEAAAGAAFSGVRSLVSMKHFGLNVACDSVFPLAYHGVKAGMVIVVADDPQGWSSGQSEQDTRLFGRVGHMPMLEPSNAQECKEFTKLAFELSELLKIPVFLRTTTRVNFGGDVVKLGWLPKPVTKGKFEKQDKAAKWRNLPPEVIKIHAQLADTLKQAAAWAEKKGLTRTLNPRSARTGVITSGVGFDYVMEALDELGVRLPVLKLGMTWPFPEHKIWEFLKTIDTVLVVEELDPVLEQPIRLLARESKQRVRVFGKDVLPSAGEYSTSVVKNALAKFVGKPQTKLAEPEKVMARQPVLCPGCPHRASFWAAKQAAGKNTVFGGDIGCYILGIFPPLETQDFVVSMGANAGIVHGIQKTTDQKAVVFVGDSTFFHASIPGLVNLVFNKSSPLVVVLDNRTTAMTGHQPHPGVGRTGMGEPAKEVKIDEVARACGADEVRVTNCFNVAETQKAMKQVLDSKKLGVVVSRGQCRLLTMRQARKTGAIMPVFEIDQKKCTKCGVCLYEFGCPAIHLTADKKFFIDADWCWGCSVCAQICPAKAIHVKKL